MLASRGTYFRLSLVCISIILRFYKPILRVKIRFLKNLVTKLRFLITVCNLVYCLKKKNEKMKKKRE